MSKTLATFLVLFGAMLFAACPPGDPTGTNSDTNAGTETAKDLNTTLADIEKNAVAAWREKNGAYFEGMLADNFVGQGGNGPEDKKMAVAGISNHPCEVSKWDMKESKSREIGDGAALIVSVWETAGKCGDQALPSEFYSASLYVKDGENWKGAYHHGIPAQPKAEEAKPDAGSEEKAEGKSEDKPEEAAKPAAESEEKKDEAPMVPQLSNDEEIAKALTEVENKLWDAYLKKNAEPFKEALTEDFTEISGEDGIVDRAGILENIAGHNCSAKSFSIAEGNANKINDNLVVFTYKATVDGTCGDQPMPKGMYLATIFVKDGDAWKPTFHTGSPATDG